MAEGQNNPSDKKKGKNRSMGVFLLFLAILVGTLYVVGEEPWQGARSLTQDGYEWLLYQGRIQKQEVVGGSRIEGVFTNESDGKPMRFSVNLPGLSDQIERYRELKAVPEYQSVSPDALMAAVQGGWYRPLEVRALKGYRTILPIAPKSGAGSAEGEKAADKPVESASPNAAASERRVEELVQVRVYAQSRSAWRRANKGAGAAAESAAETGTGSNPRFPLPDVAGTLNLSLRNLVDSGSLIAQLTEQGARFEARDYDLSEGGGTTAKETSNFLGNVLFLWGPWILAFVIFTVILRQMRGQAGAGGVMSFGRSRAQLYTKENRTNVTFDDVAGAAEAKEEVREVVEFLKNPGRFSRIGGRIPRGVLLVGPPGCGKTLLAKAIAGEANVPFFSISGSDFVEMFVGVGASRVRDLFKQARENSPCIIFLDEIDAVGRRRGSGLGGGHDEREQTLNAILVEMDGFATDEGIIVIAATNRPDVLDPALLRPGRFDREVVIDLPDLEGREEILRVHLKKVKALSEVNVKVLARSTPGYSGADLAAIINEAAIRATLAKHEAISMEDLEEARDKVRYGRQKRSRKLELEDKRITAFHEAGHAVVALNVPEVDRPHKVTIVPRGRALGATMVLPDKESYHMQKRRMLGQLALLFGGRVAEAEHCGDISAGASDDIRRATELARAMVSELGMSERVGPINYAEREGSDFLGTELMRGRAHSEQTAREIDEEVRSLLDAAYKRAEAIVRGQREMVERLSQALLTYETLSGEELNKLVAGVAVQDLRPAEPAEQGPGSEPKRASPPKPAVGPGARAGGVAGEAGLSPA
jgi:cell division protease FtsH